jgi:hypothetical protein
MTSRTLVVRVESGKDVAWTPDIVPRGQGAAVVCPEHDASIQIAFDYGGRPVVHDLQVYTFHDAIGSASATIDGGGDAHALPRITDISHDSGYSMWSVLPHGLFARGWMMGLAVGLVAASWMSVGRSRNRQARRPAAMEAASTPG